MRALFRTIRLSWMPAVLVAVLTAPPARAQGYDDQAGEHALFFNVQIQQVVGLASSLRGLRTDRDAILMLQNQLLYAGFRHSELDERVALSNGFGNDTSLREAARAFSAGYRTYVVPVADSLRQFAPRLTEKDLRARMDRIVAHTDRLSAAWRAAMQAFGAQHQSAYASRRCDRIAALSAAVRRDPLPTPQYLDGREMTVNQRDSGSLPSYFLVVSEAPVEHFDGALPSLAAFADQLSKCLPGPLVSSRHELESPSGFAAWYLLTPPGTPIDDGRAVGEAVELTLSRQSESAVGGPKTVFSIRVQGPR